MNKNYTHITMVIDRSGSMSSCWADVIGGYKNIVEKNKALPGKCTFTVAAFDNEYELVEDFSAIENVSSELKVFPRGGTALLDAIGKTIKSLESKLESFPAHERPQIIVMVQTDGYENMSKEFNKITIQELIKNKQELGWQFMFLGASMEAVSEAAIYGFDLSASACYNSSKTEQTFDLFANKTMCMRSSSSESFSQSCSFSEEERELLK